MRDVRINYAVVGAFVLAMLAALVGVVAMLTGRTGATDSYYTHFSNVGGLKYGTKVTFEGYPVGQVEEIAPLRAEGKTRFRVLLSVREGWQIPADSVARVAASGILAAVALDIQGGTSETMLAPGSEITGGPSANLFAVMNDVAGQVADLNQNALKPLLSTLNAQISTVGAALEKQAPELLANLVAVTGDLAAKTPRITADVERMTGTLSANVVNEANTRNLGQAVADMAALAAGLKESREKLDQVVGSLDKVVSGNRQTVDQALKDLRYTLQTVARNIDSVTYNLEGTSRNVHEFSRQIRENPGVLLGGRKGGDEGRR